MLPMSRFLPIVIGTLAALAVLEPPARAGIVQPCATNAANPGPGSITFLPINGGNQTYCQSAYGWSDTWFPSSQPATYNQQLDAMSGDNAPGLIYKTNQRVVGSGNSLGNPYNFISPWLDGGNLQSGFIGSSWTVLNDIKVTGNVGTSKITLGGLDLTITTTVGANGVTEHFSFMNNTGAAITDVLFSDYFNFHPNGSLLLDTHCATTTFAANPGTVTTTGSTGPGCGEIVPQGTMTGSMLPKAWDLGMPANVLSDIAMGTYNGFTGPIKGDGAADVVWDLGPLAIGGITDFTITKDFVPAPEPGSLLLLTTAVAGLLLLRRRVNRPVV